MNENFDLPLGFGMALAQNELAMKRFEMLSEEAKRSVTEKTHGIESKEQMQELVSRLASGGSL